MDKQEISKLKQKTLTVAQQLEVNLNNLERQNNKIKLLAGSLQSSLRRSQIHTEISKLKQIKNNLNNDSFIREIRNKQLKLKRFLNSSQLDQSEKQQIDRQIQEYKKLHEVLNKSNFQGEIEQYIYLLEHLKCSYQDIEKLLISNNYQVNYHNNKIKQIAQEIKRTNIKVQAQLNSSLEVSTKVNNLTIELLHIFDNQDKRENFQGKQSFNITDLVNQFSSFSELISSNLEIAARDPRIIKLIYDFPSLENFNTIKLINLFSTVGININIDLDIESFQKEVISEDIKTVLDEIGEGLSRMWEGAVASLKLHKENPDYRRHCLTSMRELFTQVLHELSSDQELKKWLEENNLIENSEFFYNKKPTRKSRLLFICRTISKENKDFDKFLESDVKTLISFFSLLNQGTHQPITPYTHEQVIALVEKIKITIMYLHKINQLNL